MFCDFIGITRFLIINIMFVENKYTSFLMRDGIIHLTFNDVNLDLSTAVSIVKDRFALQKGQSFPVLCDIRQMKRINKIARIYLSTEGLSFVSALAFIAEGPVSNMLCNFFLRTTKPRIPTMVFDAIDEAVVFLKNIADN